MKNFKLNLKSIVQSNAREKKRKEKDERVLTMKEASVQHPFSIRSASIQHPFSIHCNQEARRRQEAIRRQEAMRLEYGSTRLCC